MKDLMMTHPVRVRFAPSPTGRMHIGHLRAAVPNFLYARHTGGIFVLRFEDTDLERHVHEAESWMLEDMQWLGLTPDESPSHGGDFGPYRTRERHERGDYKKVVQQLMDMGRAYECFVSQAELDLMRKIQTGRGEPPHYDNRHRDLSDEEKQKFRAEGREPVVRFKLNDGEIVFDDLVRGEVRFDAKHLGGDPVIVRSNGIPLFTLGGVVDDINQEMTHIIRGEDHVSNTAIQVQIFEALGAKMPVFAHVPMMLDKDGHKFSKRRGSLSVDDLHGQGYLPEAIVGYMATLGFSSQPESWDMESLAAFYDINNMGKASVRFDEEQLTRLNATIMHDMSFAQVKPHLPRFMDEDAMASPSLETFWLAVRENCESLCDLPRFYALCFGELEAVEIGAEDKDYLKQAAECLPAGELDGTTWQTWTGALKEQTGRKGKALFMPLRLALTGEAHGPDLANLLPLMGADKVRARLNNASDGNQRLSA